MSRESQFKPGFAVQETRDDKQSQLGPGAAIHETVTAGGGGASAEAELQQPIIGSGFLPYYS